MKTRFWRNIAVWTLLWTSFVFTTHAHEGGHGGADQRVRTWFRSNGTHFHGSLISVDATTMRFFAENGEVEAIALSDLSAKSSQNAKAEYEKITALNTEPTAVLVRYTTPEFNSNIQNDRPAMADAFKAFEKSVRVRWDQEFLYVESNGMPDHTMMTGITAWQQQVPIPQKYIGDNAWRIPLHPKFARNPVSAKEQLFRGAIALAVNGVPIFNPIKNDGRTDTLLAGELDQYGGHCGRGDDYHYHIAPIHLEKMVGPGKPIAYALDGFPLYGYTDENGKVPNDLDEFNGRMENGSYRYYSTKTYPYINGGMRGEVTVRDDQIDPQPRAYSPRAALTPLRGAKITGFERDAEQNKVKIIYEQNGRSGSVQYKADADSYLFTFTEPNGNVKTEDYPIRADGRRPPPRGEQRPPNNRPQAGRPAPATEPRNPNPNGNQGRRNNRDPNTSQTSSSSEVPKDEHPQDAFILKSPAFVQHGAMPAEYTGDGDGISPPLTWSNAPEGTKCFALVLWHKPNSSTDEVKSYWVISNIPANVKSLEKDSKQVGLIGLNDKKRAAYDPMNSKGPGVKEYHITLYALSSEPKLAAGKFNRVDLLQAIQGLTLAESTLSYTYERKQR
ncbi:MAG: YHYH protein [Planctomycetaceae bacterium]|nr:YHYH protein [Planctomycetaceae bacterium]